MRGNRNNRNGSLLGILLPCCFVVTACGGREGTRLIEDSDVIPKGSPLQDCAAEKALEATLFSISDFDSQVATGWGYSKDDSPKPEYAPGPIYTSCPADSALDCCRYAGESAWTIPPEQLDSKGNCRADGNDCRRIKEEQKLNKKYKCAPEAGPFISVFGGNVPTQVLDVALPCDKYKDPTETHRGLHVRAARLSDWGAQVYYNFRPRINGVEYQSQDASQYDGVSFWIRLGQGGSGAQPVGRSVFVAFDDVFTKENQLKFELKIDPETGEYLMQERPNGDLEPVFELDENGQPIPVNITASKNIQANYCYDVGVDTLKCDRFGAGVGLEAKWRFVKIPFAKMRQRGFGVKSPAGRVLREQLMGMSIYVDVGNWDFWIDQVAFYKEPAQSE